MVQKTFFLRESCAWALGAFFLLGCGLVQAQEPNKINDGLSVPVTDWPWWRGPSRNGTAASDQAPPIQWDRETNIVWKTPIAGRGYGSMCLVADKVYLATARASTSAFPTTDD